MNVTTAPTRVRLPARRASVTEEIEVDGCSALATVGFDAAGRPREIFMVAGKEGSAMNMLLADAAVAISVALRRLVDEKYGAAVGMDGMRFRLRNSEDHERIDKMSPPDAIEAMMSGAIECSPCSMHNGGGGRSEFVDGRIRLDREWF